MTRRSVEHAAYELERRIEKVPDRLVAVAGLDKSRGPYRLKGERAPSGDAWQLAYQLAANVAIPAVEGFIASTGLVDFHPWRVTAKGRLDASAACLGLPLVGAFSPEAVAVFARVRLAERYRPQFGEIRKTLRLRLSNFILLEQQLWEITATSRKDEPLEIPYAFRHALLEWLWNPGNHDRQAAATICIRCGTFLIRSKELENAARRGPRCPDCARDTIKDREWPETAICPAGRGTWWLHCQENHCTTPVRGDRRTEYCDRHKARNLTLRQRRVRRRQT